MEEERLTPEVMRFIRVANGLTVYDISAITGVSRTVINRCELNRDKLEGSKLEREFVAAFGLTPEALREIRRAYEVVTGIELKPSKLKSILKEGVKGNG